MRFVTVYILEVDAETAAEALSKSTPYSLPGMKFIKASIQPLLQETNESEIGSNSIEETEVASEESE